uniref:Uncharacterized protein n=1 Tax=Chromera velia CCMP2878 TaxID=1169474 RepID=A0A0G4HTN6_9ALVE|eukprot:Cvel_8454.t1-p1 / transcript=Cvel_8454.t1 / gene=Cvel_8454 / organism=Chromera_velia_CCMP2878 / gene_product=hypothetical protein / transcript_product=hypothetical protein / location=Cvel_scaffold467:2923-9576(+) / protein_length=305 / sequence_SO=supercontig / SO=protein_coding / is_pseudo=false
MTAPDMDESNVDCHEDKRQSDTPDYSMALSREDSVGEGELSLTQGESAVRELSAEVTIQAQISVTPPPPPPGGEPAPVRDTSPSGNSSSPSLKDQAAPNYIEELTAMDLDPKERLEVMREALSRVTKAGTKQDNVGSLAYDNIIRIALRHTHYRVPVSAFPAGRQCVTDQLGVDALAAKLSANLVVTSTRMHHAHSPSGRGSTNRNGVVSVLGIPWVEIFKDTQSVPNLMKVWPVLLETLEEVVGDGWNNENKEAWEWLWGLAVKEKSESWTDADRERMFQGWQASQKDYFSSRVSFVSYGLIDL